MKPGTLLKDTDKMMSLKQQLDDVTMLTKQTAAVTGPSPVPASAMGPETQAGVGIHPQAPVPAAEEGIHVFFIPFL